MTHITESQITALELLAAFKYLTSSQFVKMGLFKKRAYVTNALKVLINTNKPLLAKHDFNPIDGKLESFYYLTKHGKNFLIDELEYTEAQIKAPGSLSPVRLKDYFHRKYTINFHIGFRQWLENNHGEISFLNYYFDKTGNNRNSDNSSSTYVTALNKIQLDNAHAFIPDINTMFSLDGEKYLYLFEQHDGKDTKRLFEQLYVHIIAISQRAVSKKYNFQKSHKVVVVCEHESVKNSVMQRLQKEKGIEDYNNFFIFKTNAELKEDFYNNWTQLNGESVTFLFKGER